MNGNGIVSKIARLAVSKAAAFTYAVAVGVAGNLAFNFVQQRHSAPPPVASAPVIAGESEAAAGAAIAPRPHRASREPVRVSLPPEKPPAPARHPAADIPALPEAPAAFALPNLDSLPAPALKPTSLPFSEPTRRKPATAAPAETARLPAPIEKAAPTEAVSPPSVSPPAPTAVLPALGQPIDVAPLPVPPSESESVPPMDPPDIAVHGNPPAPSADNAEPTAFATISNSPARADGDRGHGWQLSDIWHPGRAMAKGLHWAGDQLPGLEGDDPPRSPHIPALTRPIPLLPSSGEPAHPESASAPPGRPGPGSGGLY